jgi:glycine cleavage system H protein
MSTIPEDLKYLATHEWVQQGEDNIVTVGITDHAQDLLGDVVFVELPEVGAVLTAGDEAGVVESVKAASDIFCPVTGEVVAVNESLEEAPELVNNAPYDDGWFFKVRISEPDELDDLLSAEDYATVCENEDH